MPDEEFSTYRAQPSWQNRLAAAHTIPREIRAETETVFDPEQAAAVTVPILMLVGGDSPDEIRADPETVAAALPDARIVVLEGQQHVADVLVPEVFAEHVVTFLRDRL